MMNILLKNMITLSNIKINDKLYIIDNTIHLDDRYLISIRRYMDGSSRNDILIPIIWTYNNIFNYLRLPRIIEDKKAFSDYKKLLDTIKQLVIKSYEGLKILCQTYYFGFIELNKIYEACIV